MSTIFGSFTGTIEKLPLKIPDVDLHLFLKKKDEKFLYNI